MAMLLIFCSPGHSPGASTTAIAAALTWPRPVILAECDPAGGQALTGLCMHLLPSRGLVQWAMAVSRGASPQDELENQLLPLGGPGRKLLALPPGPAPVKALKPRWELLASTLADHGCDVIADLGRIGGTDTPAPLLTTANHVFFITRPSYPDLAAASSALRYLEFVRGTDGTKILLTGTGPYPVTTVARELPVPVAGRLPSDHKTASLLAQGIRPHRMNRRPLTRAIAVVTAQLIEPKPPAPATAPSTQAVLAGASS